MDPNPSAIALLEKQIREAGTARDQAVRDAEYETAAQHRDLMEKLRQELALLRGNGVIPENELRALLAACRSLAEIVDGSITSRNDLESCITQVESLQGPINADKLVKLRMAARTCITNMSLPAIYAIGTNQTLRPLKMLFYSVLRDHIEPFQKD